MKLYQQQYLIDTIHRDTEKYNRVPDLDDFLKQTKEFAENNGLFETLNKLETSYEHLNRIHADKKLIQCTRL